MLSHCFSVVFAMLVAGEIEGQTYSEHCFSDHRDCQQARAIMLHQWEVIDRQTRALTVLEATECGQR